MLLINKLDFLPIGTIIKPHGLRGDMILEVEDGYEDYLKEQEYLMVEIEGGLVPFFISEESLNFRTPTSLSVAFDDFDSAEKVRPLCGSAIYLHKEVNQEEIDSNDFKELLGYTVYDKVKGKLGKIIQIDNYSGNVVLTVEHHAFEVLIPLSENLVTGILDDKRELHLDCPEGLIELYLE